MVILFLSCLAAVGYGGCYVLHCFRSHMVLQALSVLLLMAALAVGTAAFLMLYQIG